MASKTTRKSPRRRPQLAMTEPELMAEILALCQGRNLWPVRLAPERFNQRDAENRGFPDLTICGPHGVLFRELKSVAGVGVGRGLNPAQAAWKHRLLCGAQDWGIWTPKDLASGLIARELHDLETPDEYTNNFSLAMVSAE